MALYRNVSLAFWDDPKVVDDFTPEDKYFYLYLLTNPHTNLAGCYEISIKQMSDETGYTKETILRLIERFELCHQVIAYSKLTKELLIPNWHKHNWTGSPKFATALSKQIDQVKEPKFREYLTNIQEDDTVSYFDRYGIDTTGIDTTDAITVTVSDTDTVKKSYAEDVKQCIEEWNTLSDYGISKISKLTSTSIRYKNLVARIKEYGIDSVIQAIDNIRHSEFLQGKSSSERTWKISFDWFVLPNNFPKVFEGKYADSPYQPQYQQIPQNNGRQ